VFTRDDIVKSARSYIGTKFRLYGRERTGVDCVGLLYCVGHDLGINIKDNRDYTTNPEPRKIQAVLEAYTRPAPAGVPRNGQVLKLRQHIFPMHLGFLVVENGRLSVINANMHLKRVVEDPWESWQHLVREHRDVSGVKG
jgi:hypothetical protein